MIRRSGPARSATAAESILVGVSAAEWVPPNADIEDLQTRSSPAAEMPPQRNRALAVGASQVAPFRMRDAYAQLCQPHHRGY